MRWMRRRVPLCAPSKVRLTEPSSAPLFDIQRREVRACLGVDLRELPADEQTVAGDRHVHHAGTGCDVRSPTADELAVRRADLRDPLRVLPVHGREVPADEHREAVGRRLDRFDLAVELGDEAVADRPVFTSKEKMWFRVIVGPEDSLTWVNLPADVHVLPIWAKALTPSPRPPSRIRGVPFVGIGHQQPVVEDRRIGRSRLHEGHHHHGGHDGYSEGTGGTLHRDTPLSYNGDSTLYPGWPRKVTPRWHTAHPGPTAVISCLCHIPFRPYPTSADLSPGRVRPTRGAA